MNRRKQLLQWLYEVSQRWYTQLFKKKKIAWSVDRNTLIDYPNDSFGYALGAFLECNDFQLIPKVERHDAYHVLTGFGTKVEDEIALQYLCFGNGKRSKYLFGVLLLGTLLLPEYWKYYIRSYRLGKNAHAFHYWDFQKVLKLPLVEIRTAVFPKEIQKNSINRTLIQ